jgi:hypothetical protein
VSTLGLGQVMRAQRDVLIPTLSAGCPNPPNLQ